MKYGSPRFASFQLSEDKRIRLVVAIFFDTASLYFTSHDDITGVPGVVLQGTVEGLSDESQRIIPNEGRSEIGTMSFRLVDVSGAVSDAFNDKLVAGEGLRNRRCRLYLGYEGLDFSEFQIRQTQEIVDVSLDVGVYLIECQDLSRALRKNIGAPVITTLRTSISADDLVIPVYDTAELFPVEHTADWSDAPSKSVGYVQIGDEKIRWISKTSDSLIVDPGGRGALNSRAKAHAVDENTAADQRTKVSEVFYLEGPGLRLAYAIKTGVLYGQATGLPEHWHMGIDVADVVLDDYLNAGPDLWVPSDPTKGVRERFVETREFDGKTFLERDLLFPLSCFTRVYADGRIGIRRMASINDAAAVVAVITERDVVGHGPLRYDVSSVLNDVKIDWSYDAKEPRRTTEFVDNFSKLVHKDAPERRFSFRGFYAGLHTETTIWHQLFQIRDRFAAPPLRLTLELSSTAPEFEVGDVARFQLEHILDLARGGPLDRAMEIQSTSFSQTTGRTTVEVFGSTARATTIPPKYLTTFPLPDSFYSSAGTLLSSVPGVTIVGNVMTAAPGTPIDGGADMNASAAIFYWLGDLTIQNGVTFKIKNNVQLRVKGYFQHNGAIDGIGQGLSGVSDDGAVSPYLLGNPGFIGNSRGRDGIRVTEMSGNPQMESQPIPTTEGRFASFPPLSLRVSGDTLLGIPTDLRGTGGGPGGKVIYQSSLRANGGAGAAGGAGLVIISRGMGLGASATIDLGGNDTTSPSPHLEQGKNFYPGSGGAGGPGAMFIGLDAPQALSVPDITGRFFAECGTVGVPFYSNEFPILFLPSRAHQRRDRGEQPYAGYVGAELISGLDLSNAAHRIQYIPPEEVPQDDVDEPPPPPRALSVTPGPGYIQVRITPADLQDVSTEIYASRSTLQNAELVDTIRGSVLNHQLVQQERRFYWARTKVQIDENTTVYSSWYPGVVSLVEATAEAVANADVPEEVDFLETFEGQNVADRYDSITGNGVVSYPAGQGSYGGRVLRVSGGQGWFVLKRNIPFDPGGFYRITVRARLVAAPTNALNDRFFAGVAAVAADGVTLLNVNGLNSQANQHYVGASGLDLGSVPLGTWITSIGYFSGVSTTPIGYAPIEDSPSTLFTGAAYFRPLIIANYDNGDGSTEIDFLRVEKWTGTRWVDIAGDAKADDRATMTSSGNLIANGGAEFGDNRNFTGLGAYGTPVLSYVATGGAGNGGAYFATPAVPSATITPDQVIPVNAQFHEYELRLSLKSPDSGNIVYAGLACLDEDGYNISHGRSYVARVAQLNAAVSAGATTIDVLAHADDWSLVSGFKAITLNIPLGYALDENYWTRNSNYVLVGLGAITKTDLGGGVWRYTLPAGVTIPIALSSGTYVGMTIEAGTFLYPLWAGEALTTGWVERTARFRDVNQHNEATDGLSYLLSGERYYTFRRGTIRVAPVILHNFGATTARTTQIDNWTMLSFGAQHRKALSPNLDPFYSSFPSLDPDFVYAEDALWRVGTPAAWTLSKTGGIVAGKALVDVAGQILASGGNYLVTLQTPDKKDFPNRFPIRRVRVMKGRTVTAYVRWRRLNTWTTSPGGDTVYFDFAVKTYNEDRSGSTTHGYYLQPGGITSINSRTVNVWQEESFSVTLGATVNDYYLVGEIRFFSSGTQLMASGQIEIDFFDIR